MKVYVVACLGFAVFLVGGGLLYIYGCLGNPVLGVDAYFANTTLWFMITLVLWSFGLYLLRESLLYAKKPKGLVFVGGSAFCFFLGYMLAESFMLNH